MYTIDASEWRLLWQIDRSVFIHIKMIITPLEWVCLSFSLCRSLHGWVPLFKLPATFLMLDHLVVYHVQTSGNTHLNSIQPQQCDHFWLTDEFLICQSFESDALLWICIVNKVFPVSYFRGTKHCQLQLCKIHLSPHAFWHKFLSTVGISLSCAKVFGPFHKWIHHVIAFFTPIDRCRSFYVLDSVSKYKSLSLCGLWI